MGSSRLLTEIIPRKAEQTLATSLFIETRLWESRSVHEGSETLLRRDINLRAPKPMESSLVVIEKAKPGSPCKNTEKLLG